MTSVIEKRIAQLAESLNKEALENPSPDVDKCSDLILALSKETKNMSMEILESTKIGKFLNKSIKSFKRHKRTTSEGESLGWQDVIANSTNLLAVWKEKADQEAKTKQKTKTSPKDFTTKTGLARTVAEYRTRLVAQRKEMYKDPPVLPPKTVLVESEYCKPPKRQKDTGALTFTCSDPDVKVLLKDFKPNRTPEEVLRAGSFGGTYFRPISSAVTNVSYKAKDVLKDTVSDEWIKELPMNLLTSMTYRPQVNKFGVKCGGSLGMWESSGWIVDSDPYGWFQWYCRFYQGRRCSDDARQISRWLKSAGPKGRFRSQLCNKIIAANTLYDDKSISPVIRQTLLHWGLEITPSVLQAHRKRVGR